MQARQDLTSSQENSRPSWLTDTVIALMKTAWQPKDMGLLPIVADALEDVGYDDKGVSPYIGEMEHFRAPFKECTIDSCLYIRVLIDSIKEFSPEGL